MFFNFKKSSNYPLPHTSNSRSEDQLKKILRVRTTSFVFDLIAIMVMNKLCVYSYTWFLEKYFLAVPKHFQSYLFARLNKLEIVTFAIIFWGYFAFCNFMMDGQTPGKVIFNLKVKNKNNLPLTFKESILRTAGYFVCYFTGSFLFLFPWFNKEKKGIPDWISDTFVDFYYVTKTKKATVEASSSDVTNSIHSDHFHEFPGQNSSHQNVESEKIDVSQQEEALKKVA